ncbi:MAG: DUF3575 domain-containing protein [Bacteroides sp.]|nr:DUF3575 domain-containing protein [Bacteroides sp.]MCM1379688.1 DUF3575 domain-containing protein [Bacteroides sp.]MCM1446043.1 DUF3575 domain-containing protein [Prevotella sp.]
MLLMSPGVSAQRVALKTNALEYLVMSPNLTLEARLSRVLSLQVGVGVNPITKPIGGIQLTNFRVEPELRYWFNRPMARHFLALSATAGNCEVELKNRVFKGYVMAAGISYGYALVLSKHWNMEAEIGVGLGHFRGYHYNNKVSRQPASFNCFHTLPVPIRFGLSFSYIFK